VRTVSGPLYGSLSLLIVLTVLPIALIFGLGSALAGYPWQAPISCSIGMLLSALWIHRSFVVSVDDSGVAIKTVRGNLAIPWTDIEELDGHRWNARLLRKSDGKRVYFASLDPGWQRRPVTLAIRRHLASSTVA
jgi:hypothetical protein